MNYPIVQRSPIIEKFKAKPLETTDYSKCQKKYLKSVNDI